MEFDFLEKALMAGIGIALLAGPLGAIVVWRRMANFGDAMGHTTLLGVCLAIILHVHFYIGLLTVCILTAFLLFAVSRQKQLANETLLAILAQVILALGLILAVTQPGIRVDLLGYLYGDILAVDGTDLLWIFCINILVWTLLLFFWRPMMAVTIHEDLAQVEGVPVVMMQWIFILLLALVFVVSMKLVGALLITALLVIPASTSRQLAKTPESMVGYGVIFGIIAVIFGILLSNYIDWPTGPAIVVVSFGLFILSLLFSLIKIK